MTYRISHLCILLHVLLSGLAYADSNRFINLSNIFSGEVASNLSAGSPLYVDANGKVAAGGPATTFVGVAGSTTVATSASYANMASLTITPTTAGTYQVHCRAGSVTHATNNASILLAVHVAGTIVSDSITSVIPFIQGGVTPSLSVPMVLYTNTETIITAGQAISCEWRTTAGTATSPNSRSILIQRIR